MLGFLDPSQSNERIRQLPLTVTTVVVALIGVISNAHALHVLRKYYGAHTTYTVVLTYLVGTDLYCCASMFMKEVLERMQYPLQFNDPVVACVLPNYLGFGMSLWSMWLVLSISYERYRAVCHPFSRPLSTTKTHLINLGVGGVAYATACPVLFMFGINSFSLPDIQNGTECGIKDALMTSYFPTTFFAVMTVLFIVLSSVIGRFYYKIWHAVKAAKLARLALTNAKRTPVTKPTAYVPDDLLPSTPTVGMESTTQSSAGRHEQDGVVIMSSEYSNPVMTHDESGKDIPKSVSEENPSADIFTLQESQGTKWKDEKHSTIQNKEMCKVEKVKNKDSSSTLTRTAVIITAMHFLTNAAHLLSLSLQSWPSFEVQTTRLELFTFRYIFNVVFLNNVFNPAVYFLSDPRFRNGLRQMYNCLHK